MIKIPPLKMLGPDPVIGLIRRQANFGGEDEPRHGDENEKGPDREIIRKCLAHCHRQTSVEATA